MPRLGTRTRVGREAGRTSSGTGDDDDAAGWALDAAVALGEDPLRQ
ncbi:hypothetical protein [Micrococcus sp. ACRRV]|nr:hypothetical protein [Micrococcus sp. ACRRV]